MAAVEHPSAAHHHTAPAAPRTPPSCQVRGQARLRDGGQGQDQRLLAALQPQRRGMLPGHGPVGLLEEDGDVLEARGAGQGAQAAHTQSDWQAPESREAERFSKAWRVLGRAEEVGEVEVGRRWEWEGGREGGSLNKLRERITNTFCF